MTTTKKKTKKKIINPFGEGHDDEHTDGFDKWCCINSSGRTDFVRSYLLATKILAQGLDQKDGVLFYPLAFMIRHSIELLLKNELLEKCKKKFDDVKKNRHNLKCLMNDLVGKTNLFDYISKKEIEKFNHYDNGSFEFRYPFTMNNVITCGGLCCFGINEAIELCDNMLEYLDDEYPENVFTE